MAGLGTKLWTSGEVVTAAGVNGYLQDQTIGKFATTTARDAAFGGAGEPTLSEGMFAYTSDTDTLWFYTGSAWEVATIKPSLVDAKGDLIAGTANDTVGRLAVGTNGQVLTANSAASTGLSWALPKVLQVVSAGTTIGQFTTSSTYATITGMSATITPSSTTSKILVIVAINGASKEAGSTLNGLATNVVRGATVVGQISQGAGANTVNQLQIVATLTGVYLDAPNTTSATTYNVQFATIAAGFACYVQRGGEGSTITLMEISA